MSQGSAVLLLFPHLVLTSTSLKSAHRADPGRAGASRSCAGCCVEPRLNQGSQACFLFSAALTPMHQVSRAATDKNTHHQLQHSHYHTGNGTQMGTVLSDIILYPKQGLSATLVCCPEPSSGSPVTDQSPID